MQKSKKERVPLTQERVRVLFNVDSNTGVVTRKITVNYNAKIGDTVGSKGGSHGYLSVSVDGKIYLLHRIIWLWLYGYFPEHHIDHENRDRRDNSPSNLREVSVQCNIRNSVTRSTNTSGVKGVSWDNPHRAWHARIKVNGKTRNLHYHKNFTEAVAHRYAAEQCLDYSHCDRSSSAYQYMQEYLKQQGILK